VRRFIAAFSQSGFSSTEFATGRIDRKMLGRKMERIGSTPLYTVSGQK
jgi:hypothetical protein